MVERETKKVLVRSCIARDILAILVSVVSSESAFSTRGRILDSFYSCLQPTTVQALIYTLKTPKTIDLRVEMDEVQQIELGMEIGDLVLTLNFVILFDYNINLILCAFVFMFKFLETSGLCSTDV